MSKVIDLMFAHAEQDESRRGQTQTKILRGAALAFETKGYANTTVADILETANVSRRTYYQFFDSKEDALQSLFVLMTDTLVKAVADAIEQGNNDLPDVVDRILDTYLSIQISGGRLLNILQSEAFRPDSQLSERRDWVVDQIVDMLHGVYCRAAGRDLDPLMTRFLVLGLESLCIHLHQQDDYRERELQRIRAAAYPLLIRAQELATPRAELDATVNSAA